MLKEDIQVKEAEALRAIINMLVVDMSEQIKGKTLICKVDKSSIEGSVGKEGNFKNFDVEYYWKTNLLATIFRQILHFLAIC